MGLSEWVRETVVNARDESPKFALKHAVHTLYLGGLRRISPMFDDPDDFWAEDWDVLLILDACRLDLMREACENLSYEWLPDPEGVGTVRSPASSSQGWMAAHFGEDNGSNVSQTGYITSNLFVHDFPTERFPVFSEVTANLEMAEGIRLVEPRRLTDRAIDVWRRREKLGVERLIVHYMQPHTPFRSHPEWFIETDHTTGWGLGFLELRDGKFDREEFWNAYRDNLEWVLEDVDVLVHNCDADIAITSDHGNGFGEWGVYGHPDGIPFDVVREVPWIDVRGRDERTHVPKLPENYLQRSASLDESAVSEQLEALGYAE